MYRVTEIDADGETHMRLSAQEMRGEEYGSRFESVEVGVDNVVLEELINYIESELESENHHNSTGLPRRIADVVKAVAGERAAMLVLWELSSDLVSA